MEGEKLDGKDLFSLTHLVIKIYLENVLCSSCLGGKR